VGLMQMHSSQKVDEELVKKIDERVAESLRLKD
jgi:hypothetical protein